MNEFIKRVQDIWDGLDSREQNIAMGLGILILLFVLYLIMVRPLQNKVENLEDQNSKLIRDYQVISSYVPVNQNKNQHESADHTASLEKAIDRASKDYSLKVTKINRSGEAANIEIGTTDTVTLFYFINELEKKYAIYVQSIDLEPDDKNNVKVRKLMLGRYENK